MDSSVAVDGMSARPPWEREERLVHGAILMVSSNGAPRVMVAGITFGEQIVDRCRRTALEAGVRIVPRRAVGDRLDLLVEAIV